MRARETFILTFSTGDERTNEAWKIVAVASSKTFPISTEKINSFSDRSQGVVSNSLYQGVK